MNKGNEKRREVDDSDLTMRKFLFYMNATNDVTLYYIITLEKSDVLKPFLCCCIVIKDNLYSTYNIFEIQQLFDVDLELYLIISTRISRLR